MAARLTPPFRADHVGSLLRPPELLRARTDQAAGRIKTDELRAIEDEAIRSVVAMQAEVGLRSATDGEFRRASWHMDFIYRLGGISPADEQIKVRFHRENGDIEFTTAALRVRDRIRLEETIFADDFGHLRDLAAGTGATPKLTIPSPNMVHYRGGPASIDPAVYPDVEEFWSDLASAYAEQVRRLGELGCAYLQFDDTSLAYLNDPAQRAMVTERGDDAEHLHLRYIRQINGALAGRPDGMAITTHMCRGNFRSAWTAQGGYDFVAEALFSELNVDGFFLEYDDDRSGGFEPLRFIPKGKTVVLGLVTTKRGALESKDDLKRRIEAASRHVPIEQICLSPQCGFSSTVEGNALSHDEQKAKLRLIVETAEEVWG
ncbi:5-methyltetrahydropteroyltriglutamate--homocysteine S-methyltransferase [Actinomadura barringtoniae]|uniref:5-methyltetrahydropteroyltriglutamate--homocysteine S-methyltransferase n=1 Tax=Actinomadura barringtoniae TaxID=1427535 RepID=A0A939PS11_9ACTN|nr:5-methyltetrahydropteroyltriglutamate--homocysteine S-methyltransferase [Actinomadura barringtoniae]MBO2455174.1 5-methyltetrahydropteroyltriglutamate--homocysteine S-methyltransferase [Actinomadura barringtoniae]